MRRRATDFPCGMTEADLGVKSIPRNPLLFGILHRMNAVEHIGSGIRRIRSLCREYKVAEPQIEVSEHWFTMTFPRSVKDSEAAAHDTPQVTPKVTGEVVRLLRILANPKSGAEMQTALTLRSQANFRDRYLRPALDNGLIEMTIPEKPNSRLQKYRLTLKGRRLLGSTGDTAS